MEKDQDREVIARHVEEFLARGGVIEVVETKRVCPKRLQWVADRGMDYSEWDEIGGSDWYRRDGDSRLDAEDFEED
jgi:hypothetical protein